MANFIKSLIDADDPERIKKIIQKLDEDANEAVEKTLELSEAEFAKLAKLIEEDSNSLTEDSILLFRKTQIAIQLFARQIVGAGTLVKNIERIMSNTVFPLFAMTDSISGNSAIITLKIDGISMYAKLLQAFEDYAVPFSQKVLEIIVSQLQLHASLFGPEAAPSSNIDPFEMLTLRELYSELISQSVDVCCSLVLVSPQSLASKAVPLFIHSCHALSHVFDYNCKYEVIELIAQMCLLSLKNGDEQHEDEDFLDFEMRQIQAKDEALYEGLPQPDSAKPLWDMKASLQDSQIASQLNFKLILDTLNETLKLFESETYEEDIGEEEDEEEEEEEEDDDEQSVAQQQKSQNASSSASSSNAVQETQYDDEDIPNLIPSKSDQDAKSKNTRKQEEAGTASVIALLSGITFKYFSLEEHSQVFNSVLESLLKKIKEAFSSPTTYGRLPTMIDSLHQLLKYSHPSLINGVYSKIAALLEEIIKKIKIWKSEDPSPNNRRIYSSIRSDLAQCYSTLIKLDPPSSWNQYDHFMTAVTYLMADPGILADFATSLASLKEPQDVFESVQTKLSKELIDQITKSYLKELSNDAASASMKKYVMQSIGRLAIGVGSLFRNVVDVTAPVLLYLGKQNPEFATSAITAFSQILFAVRNTELAANLAINGIDYSIEMIMEDIYLSGFSKDDIPNSPGAKSRSKFNFALKQKNDESYDEEEEEDEESTIQDDILTEMVYKAECFIHYVIHVPELVKALESTEAGKSIFPRIFKALVELEEKPTLFEEDAMLKMTGVDIIVFMVSQIKSMHTSELKAKALKVLKASEVDHFEEELAKVIKRLENIQIK